MASRYGVALIQGDTVTAEACFPDPRASAITSLTQLRSRQDVQWITNFSADELRDRRLAGNVVGDGFLGVRIASVMAELGLSLTTGEQARHAVVTLAAVVAKTFAMAEQAFGMTDEHSLVDAAKALGITSALANTRDESSLLLMVSTTAALRPPMAKRPGWSVMPLRRHRFAHAQEVMECSIPEGLFESTPVEQLDLDGDEEFQPILLELASPMEGLFGVGPYGHRPLVSLREYRAYLRYRPDVTPRIVQAWSTVEWADHCGEVAPIPIVLGAPEREGEPKMSRCGPLRVRGADVLSYSLGLVGEALWRAITTTCGPAATWMLSFERYQTVRYAMAIEDAIRSEGLSDAMGIVSFRHGVVWLETSLPPTEERWTALTRIAERTTLLPPPMPVCEPSAYRYQRAKALLSPRHVCMERHWLGAMLSLSDAHRRRLI
jgi:hypothetical protein